MSAPSTTEAPVEPVRAHPGRTLIAVTTVGVAAIWLLLDQATKILAVELLEAQGRVIDLGFIDLNVIRNHGGAFGIPGLPGLFVLVTVVVVTLVVRALPRTDRLSLAVAYGLVCGGALGNVADRLFRDPGFPSGAVVDFLDLRWWPIFNLADIGIVTGAIAIAALMTIVDREERQAAERRERAESIRPDTSTPGR
ncbi:MAG TPA: signal peptidase II [Egibacteraceae bacterium]|nr:signal peptidase II [Egibacteraceae bacterium]